MNLFRSIAFARSIVFLMVSMMFFHSIDVPNVPRAKMKSVSSDNITFVSQIVYEHDGQDKEGRISGLAEITLYKNQVSDIDFSSLPCVTVKFNSRDVMNLFKSIAFDQPSPPPKG